MSTRSTIPLREPASQAARAAHELLANVNHELRTPLTSIHGALGMLEMLSEPLSPKGRQLLDVARRNSERLLRLVDDLLERERDADCVAAKSDLPSLLKRARDLNEPYAAGRGVRIELWPCPDAVVRGHEDRLLQALTNLLSNAVKFSSVGSTVVLAAFRHRGAMRVAVADEGPGIPDEFRGRIFRRFARGRDAEAGTKGTGLGLSIAREIVEAVGGAIGFESAPGLGTTFFLDLVLCP